MEQTECMACQLFPHTGGSIPLRISRYINAINNRATTICKDMRICAGQMWSALFKYILTTAVLCASQSPGSAEGDYLEDRKKNRLSFVCYRRRGARCATMRLLWIKKDQAIFRAHICSKTSRVIKHGTYMLSRDERVTLSMARSGRPIDYFIVITVT